MASIGTGARSGAAAARPSRASTRARRGRRTGAAAPRAPDEEAAAPVPRAARGGASRARPRGGRSRRSSWSHPWFAMSGGSARPRGVTGLGRRAHGRGAVDEDEGGGDGQAGPPPGPHETEHPVHRGSALLRRHIELNGHAVTAGADDLDRAHHAVLGDARTSARPPSCARAPPPGALRAGRPGSSG